MAIVKNDYSFSSPLFLSFPPFLPFPPQFPLFIPAPLRFLLHLGRRGRTKDDRPSSSSSSSWPRPSDWTARARSTAFAANLQEEQRSWFDRRRDKFRPRQLLTYLRPGKTKSATAETIYGDGPSGKKQGKVKRGTRNAEEALPSSRTNDGIGR